LGSRVSAEYDSGVWRKLLDDRSWECSKSLQDFLIGDDLSWRLARVGGASVRIRTRDYYAYRMRAVAEVIGRYAASPDVVELGSGYGRNLFSLLVSQDWHNLVGLDVSENALAAGRQIASHFGVSDRLRFATVDLTHDGHPGLCEITGKTALTFFCLEQIPYSVESVVRNILAHSPRRVVHVESAPEMLTLWRPRDLLNYLYIRSMDYQTQLFSVLRKLAGEGAIRILEQQRVPFAPTLHNDGFLVVWEPYL
jgi:SAM-dependent methyltransferase